MTGRTDRTWDLPSRPWIMRMTWSELLFAHWPVDPNALASLLPVGLELDTRDGQAWIGVVPFLMSDVAPRCFPGVPRLSRFLELNVRTYVTRDDKPGVWFFSLDAASRLAVRAARATFHLPYMDARMSMVQDDSQQIDYRSQRTHRGEPPALFDASYQATSEPFHSEPGTLEHWLTARYCLYCSDRKGRVYRGEIDHDPWSLSHATWTVRENTMCVPLGLELTGEPHLLCAEPIAVRAWQATRCD
ncbi:DUF2071 domain-containing protein [Blastopirellula sp. JC732]|uniref:DUF2071 domain-containing protein n=1 Tax=Blastopirellula sediminis TaxID=2894196 RepID=A0A9X1MKW6_9BACT|nr:DUF2071 domain-containing protein [Blastopirellula sediminis]MCC9609421.1 DUF2071 domain-containing protein [Blastopirellula sediminis]MCC9627802.1 DUF2071 domain-containing protein [Blastopirellula sediminis]